MQSELPDVALMVLFMLAGQLLQEEALMHV